MFRRCVVIVHFCFMNVKAEKKQQNAQVFHNCHFLPPSIVRCLTRETFSLLYLALEMYRQEVWLWASELLLLFQRNGILIKLIPNAFLCSVDCFNSLMFHLIWDFFHYYFQLI